MVRGLLVLIVPGVVWSSVSIVCGCIVSSGKLPREVGVPVLVWCLLDHGHAWWCGALWWLWFRRAPLWVGQSVGKRGVWHVPVSVSMGLPH